MNLADQLQAWLQAEINAVHEDHKKIPYPDGEVTGLEVRVGLQAERIERLSYELTVTQEALHRHEVELLALRKERA